MTLALFIADAHHSWLAFALGAFVAAIIFFVIPKLRKRKEP